MEVNCCCRYASKSGSVGGGRRGGHKRKAEWSAPAWARRSENYDDAPLSVDQVDVIPLWTPAKLVAGAKGTAKIMPITVDRSSGDSAAENVKPEDKGIFPGPMSHLATDTEMETVKELPAETKTLGVGSDEEGRGNSCFSGESKTRYPRRSSRRKLFYEENVTKDDDFIYCADCEEEKEGECPYHPLFLILDNPVVRDGSEKDRARLTAPWPLTVYDSKVKGAGKGVWTNAHLPAHLVFGPYEGRVLSGHPEAGKESGYGRKIRGAGTRNTCIDAVDSAVSNWMRYVNCSRSDAETNLSVFQYKGQIYYKTDSAISRGSELMCWYGDDFGKDLGLSREPSKWKSAKKDVIDRQCEWSGLVYTSKDLMRPLKVFRKHIRTYTPPTCSTRGTSSSSGSTKQSLREEAPQIPEKASHETLCSPACDEYNTECSQCDYKWYGRLRASSPRYENESLGQASKVKRKEVGHPYILTSGRKRARTDHVVQPRGEDPSMWHAMHYAISLGTYDIAYCIACHVVRVRAAWHAMHCHQLGWSPERYSIYLVVVSHSWPKLEHSTLPSSCDRLFFHRTRFPLLAYLHFISP
ncbi:putative histone-lysine N-methyltransferase PRDM7 [Penaeus vannamei]|uniref:Putative histone-lysine N-methyltransferase PRDM7 n=1 Tax=Penaeus vannamei TaxID=6689 RepID=A0A423TIQ4_PENVA|nr:putative histone-lysine N-methyltransferase PRDM7 [Penaeus vannamei]